MAEKVPTTKGYDNVNDYVRKREAFQTPLRQFMHGGKGRHLMARWVRGVYVIYAYGEHYPMYIYEPDLDRWYENSDKWSPTTSRLKSRAYPGRVDVLMDTKNMQLLVSEGAVVDRVRRTLLKEGGLVL